ncbi:MAG: hypothetical protein U0790_06920 [Isosphaeraceae bacterium]
MNVLRHACVTAAGWCLMALAAAGAHPADPQRPTRGEGDSGPTMKARITRRPGQDRAAGKAAPARRGAGFALEPEGAAWTLRVGNGSEVVIQYEGVEVARGAFAFAAQGGAQAPGQFTVPERSGQQVQLKGVVEPLGLQWSGRAVAPSPREVRIELDVVAAKALSGIDGGGMAWTLKPDARVLRGKAETPELLPDRTGWRWEAAPGKPLTVRFDRPIARLFFDKDRKAEIRTSFVGDRIRAGRGRIALTVALPEGGRVVATDEERYAEPDRTWFRQALRWDSTPVDLSFLNSEDRPAGRHGVVRAEGDRLVFADGTPARFWGTNLAGPVLFDTPRESVPLQARRIARLGYNLVRIHQEDAHWVNPNIFGRDARDTRHLDPRSLEAIDLWIKCLKDEGIYVWLDLHYLRELKPADGVTLGWDELARSKGNMWGFNFVNPQLVDLMKEYNRQYLSHVNQYTGLAYKDDPAVVGILITNENDLTSHFGVAFLEVYKNLAHKALYDREMTAFAKAHGLPADRIWRSWEPGPAKYFQSELEHRFFSGVIEDLRSLGVKAPIAGTNFWGGTSLLALPSLTGGDVIDAHMYGASEELGANPHDRATFLSWATAAQVYGKPVTITEWNVPYPALDRFTTPLYVASVASLQGWDAPMLYNYATFALDRPIAEDPNRGVEKWSTYNDPAITGVMPAAALLFRRGHVSPARKTYCLMMTADQLFGAIMPPEGTPAVRTLAEQSRFTLGMPATTILPWLKPSEPTGDVIVFSDPNRDFVPDDAVQVESDTGELVRNWKDGVQTINTPRTQAVNGWIGGKSFQLKDASFEFRTRKAVVALTSVDDQPLASSRFLLITAVAQSRPSPPPNQPLAPGKKPENLPFRSEPVVGTIRLRNATAGLELLALGADGKVLERTTPARGPDGWSSACRPARHPLVRGAPPAVAAGSGLRGPRRPPPSP